MRILVADDEALERDALEMLIHRYDDGIPVIKAKNGKEALCHALSDDADLFILDIRMPVMDGLEAAARIREEKPEAVVLFLTAWGDFSYAQKAVRLGVSDYLVKPISYDVLAGTLDRLLPVVREKRSAASGVVSDHLFMKLGRGGQREEIEHMLGNYGVTDFSGTVFAAGLSDAEAVMAAFAGDAGKDGVRILCHDSENLRTFLSFGLSPRTVMKRLSSSLSGTACVGVGSGFSSVGDIPASVSASHSAYMQALSGGGGIASSSNSAVDLAFDRAKVMRMTDDLLRHTLSGDVDDVGRTLDSIFDELECSMHEKELEDELCEMALVYRHNVQRRIPLFFHPEPSGRQVADMEQYIRTIACAAAQAAAEDRQDKYRRVFNLLAEYLACHYQENPGQEEVAAYIGIKPSYFSRLFKEYHGINFSQYMQNLKMDKARKLLAEGRSVREAAEMTGFSDPNYFTRVFRARFNVSPKNFKP